MRTSGFKVQSCRTILRGCVPVLIASLLLFISSCSRPAESAPDSGAQGPTAPVVKVTRQNLTNELEIASEFRPYQEIEVHAKESGYVKQLYIDWGTHVKTGQLMAVLEIPELEEQVDHDKAAEQRSEQDLARAKEELTRDRSAYQVAHLTYTRLEGVQKTNPGLVAQEEVDVAEGKDQETNAEVSASLDAVAAAQQELAAARATLQKDQALFSYARITAPFDGVVTELDAYTGALLPAGTSTSQNGLQLCRLSQNDLLRLVIPVPETVVPDVHIGESVDVRVTALNRKFQGKVTRTSDQIDLETRTMHTEVQVPNPDYEIVPGMYAYVELPTARTVNVLGVPIQAVRLSGNDTGTVMVVNGQDAIEQRQVKIGVQTADNVQIASGLAENELVIFGEQNQFRPGQIVKPKLVNPASLNGSE
jgi:RND family efflux transporter MFP subunit